MAHQRLNDEVRTDDVLEEISFVNIEIFRTFVAHSSVDGRRETWGNSSRPNLE